MAQVSSNETDVTRKLISLLNSIRAPKSAYQPLPRSITEAVVQGDIPAIKVLLENGGNINERSIGYASPLHAACSFGHLEVAKFLHAAGVPLITAGQMFTCIHFAAGKGFVEIIKWSLDSGFPITEAASAFANAAACGQLEVVQLLLDRGVDTENAKVYGSGPHKKTPAHFAKAAGFSAIPDLIEGKPLDQEKHKREQKSKFDTHNPAALESPRITDPKARDEVVSEVLGLIKFVKDPNKLDKEGISLLVRAVSSCEIKLVEGLIQAGASPSIKAAFGGITPLTEATTLGQTSIIKYLLDCGAEIDSPDGSGRTPLMLAVSRGDPELVALLVERGASLSKKDSVGKTALKYIDGVHGDKIKSLLQKKCSKSPKKKEK